MKNLVFIICLILFVKYSTAQRYDPTWESLDSRPLPQWFDQSKIGIFIHWGLYAVPGFQSEWFWKRWGDGVQEYVDFMNDNYPPGFTYQDFGSQFTAEFYDPTKWAELFQKSGAKYVVLTSKHHEGYTLWPSKYSFSWNAMDLGAHRDLVGEFATAIRENTNLHFGLYHSLFEWYNPLFLQDQANEFWTDDFAKFKTMPELYELVEKYQPEIIWSDGSGNARTEYWQAKEFLAWLYNDSPVKDTVVTNDRWGNETKCAHGGYFTCSDGYIPGLLPPYKWESCRKIDKVSWGARRNSQVSDYLTPEEMLKYTVETIAYGGNILLNVGPTKEGIIVPIQEERLLQLGEWLGINGDAIYESVPWTYQNDTVTPLLWYTSKPALNQIFAITLNWPGTSPLHLGAVDPNIVDTISILGGQKPLTWSPALNETGILVTFPSPDEVSSKWAWTLIINQK